MGVFGKIFSEVHHSCERSLFCLCKTYWLHNKILLHTNNLGWLVNALESGSYVVVCVTLSYNLRQHISPIMATLNLHVDELVATLVWKRFSFLDHDVFHWSRNCPQNSKLEYILNDQFHKIKKGHLSEEIWNPKDHWPSHHLWPCILSLWPLMYQ